MYNPEYLERPYIVVLNKIDLPGVRGFHFFFIYHFRFSCNLLFLCFIPAAWSLQFWYVTHVKHNTRAVWVQHLCLTFDDLKLEVLLYQAYDSCVRLESCLTNNDLGLAVVVYDTQGLDVENKMGQCL